MKLHLLPFDERFRTVCYLCGGSPVKYRVHLQGESTETGFIRVSICNRCALRHMDELLDFDQQEPHVSAWR